MIAHTLYFIRHGETDWNAARRIQGHTDIPLNDTGREQARRNGRMLASLVPDAHRLDFIASPLSRAQETMRLVRRELAMPAEGYRLDDRIKELHFGRLEGQTWVAAQRDSDPSLFADRTADPYNWRPEAGESYADLTARLAAWLATLRGDSVVVSHGGVSRALRGLLVGIEKQKVPDLRVPQDKVLVLAAGRMEWV